MSVQRQRRGGTAEPDTRATAGEEMSLVFKMGPLYLTAFRAWIESRALDFQPPKEEESGVDGSLV